MSVNYDIIVVGGGHAGIEAANASSKFGHKVALITFDLSAIGRLSCNPAIGGIAKSNVVREVDCLGGLMGRIADETAIQYRVLNLRKGAAVRATRSQNERSDYPKTALRYLRANPNIDLIEAEAAYLVFRNGNFHSVRLASGEHIFAKAVIIATGTFLGGKIFTGPLTRAAGRLNEPPSNLLSDSLNAEGFSLKRFKTGTPPRILANSIDFDKLTRQDGDDDYRPFSIETKTLLSANKQIPCWITRTNEKTHELVLNNLGLSPLFDNRIVGKGPRYCPSIEVKVIRFPDNPSHTIFLEPEGINSREFYVNGISMSLPAELQVEILRTIPGLTRCEITQWAYAVEYDCIDPTQLDERLCIKGIDGVFFAGQVNGTSGYEEAAGQGIFAGINASLFIEDRPPFILSRSESYIAVMLDDILTRGADEPYRLFTSRSEFRLKLREDNAIWRMLPYSERYGLLPQDTIDRYKRFEELYNYERERFAKDRIPEALRNLVSSPNKPTGLNYLKHPDARFSELVDYGYSSADFPREVSERLEIEAKYEGFILREENRAVHYSSMLGAHIPEGFDYSHVDGLSSEAKERFILSSPKTLREASEISGITPSAILALYIHLNCKKDVSRETSL